ncbi:unnamed protein product [Enterobius vermicularis]|uniref:Ig-like domain-containing protein n=1 Tax=Enterobius vermicularis TaxID=51028 RepID=A0A0N4VAW6_ENTVE|nr:unnamed protein product [Enterobius vermicularis]
MALNSSNAILHNRPYHSEQPLPDVGFLVITSINKEDEGKYWCRRDDTRQEGEITNIRVAYVDDFPAGTVPIFKPIKPIIGDRVEATCPKVSAVPEPSVVWLLNGKPLDFASDRISAFNSTLRFRRFLNEDIGQYECVISNFAGRTSAKIYVEAHPKAVDTVSVTTCRNFASQSAMLWFLVGSLATCCFLLCYMLTALYCLRRGTQNRITLYPAMFLRSYSGLGPGFRKTIVPTPDVCRDRRIP